MISFPVRLHHDQPGNVVMASMEDVLTLESDLGRLEKRDLHARKTLFHINHPTLAKGLQILV